MPGSQGCCHEDFLEQPDLAMKPPGPHLDPTKEDWDSIPETPVRPEPTTWNQQTQTAVASLLVITLFALGFNVYLASRPAARPTHLIRVIDHQMVEHEPGDPEVALPPSAMARIQSLTPVLAPVPVTRKMTDRDAPLDLNRATIHQLQMIPGIGPAMAERIDSHRNRQPFRSVEELRQISGIGVKTLEKIRPFVTVSNLEARKGV